jgi:alpha-glucosidase
VSDEQARILEIKLSFLTPGTKYLAEVYRDGENADWKTNPYEIIIEKKEVNSEKTLSLNLAPGGGAAIAFKSQEIE